MADILVNGNFGGGFQHATSFAMVPTPFDQLNQYGIQQSTPQSAIQATTPPVFAGPNTLVAQDNGSLLLSWLAGTTTTNPLMYDVYIQANTATGLYSPANLYDTVQGLSVPIFTLGMGGALLVKGTTYYVGVRARDRLNNVSVNSNSLAAISQGVNPNRVMTPDDIPAIWAQLRSLNQVVGSFGEALQGVITPTRANNLDNLDATVSTRATQASVDAIQNATTFVGVVPSVIVLPASGSKVYRFYASLYDDTGMPENPDGNMDITITDSAGVPVVATTAMTNEAVGRYYFDYTVNSTDAEQGLRIIFDYVENAVPFRHYRVTEVQEFESKLDVLISRLTSTRAANLDNLDAQVSTRQPISTAQTQYLDLKSDISTRQSTADSITQTAAIQSDIAAVEKEADALARYNDAASRFDHLDNQTEGILDDIADVKADTTILVTRVGVPETADIAGDIDRVFNRIGAPANGSIAEDIAEVAVGTNLIHTLTEGNELNGVIEFDDSDII